MQFDWDSKKAAANLKKHRVSFEEAETVFGDPLARIFDDDFHSLDERRSAIFGHSNKNRLLIVSYAEQEGDKIRLISARQATPKEGRRYAN
ncbi:MAG: BrnT family toxin [Acidobacteria bacterium]|nr:BrnT family toxin [Acidobacteriota bacterium]